jgi:uncharacterized membrane protein
MSTTDHENHIVSTFTLGLLGAGLAYFGRRNKGVLATISTTLGYSLIAKAASSSVIAALKATEG